MLSPGLHEPATSVPNASGQLEAAAAGDTRRGRWDHRSPASGSLGPSGRSLRAVGEPRSGPGAPGAGLAGSTNARK